MSLSGAVLDAVFGDREMRCKSAATAITVTLLGSRNADRSATRKSLLGKVGRHGNRIEISFFHRAWHPIGGCFYFIFLCKNKDTKGKNMKKTGLFILSLILALLCCLPLAACREKTPDDLLWESAIHTEDATVGEGAITFDLAVITGECSVTLTVKTDETNLAAALLALGLITGEEGPYGLYVKSVNGILADYDVDNTYWKLSKNGTELMTGASGVTVASGDRYEFTRAK